MSSTNRKSAALRHKSDYYITPQSSIKEFLAAFNKDFPFGNKPIAVIDPCAGGDAKNGMSYPEAIKAYSGWNIQKLTTMDIREDSKAEIKGDYLVAQKPKELYDVVITNPPFNIALDVIQKALIDTKEGGYVIMLLRLNFFGSQLRSAWFKANPPLVFYIHSKRMKFLQTKNTDSVEYMHCVWCKGGGRSFPSHE